MRKCFERNEVGLVVVPKHTVEIIQSIADECVDKLLTQLPDVDFCDLQKRFEDVFEFRYTSAMLQIYFRNAKEKDSLKREVND